MTYEEEKQAHAKGVIDALNAVRERMTHHIEATGFSVLVINRIIDEAKKSLKV